MNTQVQVVPSNLQLPAHLQTPDVIAAIAAANAAAAGGVRAGGFPSISIKSNHFHIRDGDETTTLMVPPTAPGQPALPMMCLEVVVVDANPALSHTFFGEQKNGVWMQAEYVEGENKEPTCRSANGVTPDSDAPAPQSAVCATCPQYQWGSAISKLTGKPIRACHDSKQLAILPAGDLAYKMLGLQIKVGSLKNWGTYVRALNGRGYGIATLVTNVTFDQTSNGVLQFTFNRFLTANEFAAVNARKPGDDVKVIVAQSRALAPSVAMLPPPLVAPALAAPVAPSAPPVVPPYIPPVTPAPPAPATGFNAAPPVAIPASVSDPVGVTIPEPPKRTRAPRAKPVAPAANNLSHIPAAIMATINAVGVNSPAGQALIAAYPAPTAQPAAPAPVAVPVADAAPVAPVAVAPTVGFGAAPVTAPTAQVIAAGASLADRMRAKLAGQ